MPQTTYLIDAAKATVAKASMKARSIKTGKAYTNTSEKKARSITTKDS